MESVLQGGIAGLLATVPMTAVMAWLHRRLPAHERYALPPRRITMRVVRRLGLGAPRTSMAKKVLTSISHFGYGSAAGAVFQRVIARAIRPGPVSGIAFGLAVWAGSYLGLLPATGLLAPATQHPPRRTALMIGAHVVWGATLGELSRRMEERAPSDSRLEPSAATRAPVRNALR